ncbi:MAG: hypothetical protein SAJ72_16330 [Jaaginema sp. PMC 1080.18]|nr:hypothetical protein [Jaaginema sp. PMC 1080.18]MEC4866924.1 hypothetical protein [Jaaginema sp. PMC 1078.18]
MTSRDATQGSFACRYTDIFAIASWTSLNLKIRVMLLICITSGQELLCGFLGQISGYYLTSPIAPIKSMLGIAIPAAHAAIAYGY